MTRLRVAPRERIDALVDPGSATPLDAAQAAPRPSPHLVRWGIAVQDDDGVVLARATVGGERVLIAAQDDRFLGGSVGARHADALRALFELAADERPSAAILLCASGGVRLYEANPAELALARALASMLDLRSCGVRVLAIGTGDVFGGAAVLACAADRTAFLPQVRMGLSGPKVIEFAQGREEFDASDHNAVETLFGVRSRAAAGQIEVIAEDRDGMRNWISSGVSDDRPFSVRVASMQQALGARVLAARESNIAQSARGARELPAPATSIPPNLAELYSELTCVDGAGWLWRMPDHPVWFTRAYGAGHFGPLEAFSTGAALLAHLAESPERETATLFVVSDCAGHETTRAAESLCVAQYLAQHAAVLALLRSRGVRVAGLLAGTGHSAAFFANALQGTRVYALETARVVAMEPAAIARVTGMDPTRLAAAIESDPLVGSPVRHFASWGGIAQTIPDFGRNRLLDLAAREREYQGT